MCLAKLFCHSISVVSPVYFYVFVFMVALSSKCYHRLGPHGFCGLQDVHSGVIPASTLCVVSGVSKGLGYAEVSRSKIRTHTDLGMHWYYYRRYLDVFFRVVGWPGGKSLANSNSSLVMIADY